MTPSFCSKTLQKKGKKYIEVELFYMNRLGVGRVGGASGMMQESGEGDCSKFHLSLNYINPKELLPSPLCIRCIISLNPISSPDWAIKHVKPQKRS